MADAVDDRIRDGGAGGQVVAVPELPQMVDGTRERAQHLAAARTAREMPQHALLLASRELAVEVLGEMLLRLLVRCHPRPHQCAHDPFDAYSVHSDSTSYDPRVPLSPDDAELVARARGGDVDAFAEFVRRHEARVRLVLARMLADQRDVEEASQDVFVQAWRNLDRYRGDAGVFTWLYRIAVNEALARLRRRQLQLTDIAQAGGHDALATAPEAGPEARAQSTELREFLAAQLQLLPLEYRAPIVLRDVVGLSNQEVAEILELTVAATKSRVHRARMEMRERIAEWDAASERP